MHNHLIPEQIRRELLQPNSVQLEQLQQGGLSGAMVWRAQSIHGATAVRRWPAKHPSPARLSQIHAAMIAARESALSCIPAVHCNRAGETFTSDGQQLWELTQWMPGRADYPQAASDSRLRAALQQLAHLHHVWEISTAVAAAPSETLAHRYQRLQSCMSQLPRQCASGISNPSSTQPPMSSQLIGLARDTLRLVAERGPALLTAADQLRGQAVKQHFVIRDIWSDHVLFTGDQVTGIIDFGAARIDEPATDVARLLGSLEPMDGHRWNMGWDFYHQINRHVDLRRVQLLDRLATLLSAVQWLEWLVLKPRHFDAPLSSLITRWQQFIVRCESWN